MQGTMTSGAEGRVEKRCTKERRPNTRTAPPMRGLTDRRGRSNSALIGFAPSWLLPFGVKSAGMGRAMPSSGLPPSEVT